MGPGACLGQPPCRCGSPQPLGLVGICSQSGTDVCLRHSAVRRSGLVPAGDGGRPPTSGAFLETGLQQEAALWTCCSPPSEPLLGGPWTAGPPGGSCVARHVLPPQGLMLFPAPPPPPPRCCSVPLGRWGLAPQALPGHLSFWNLFRNLSLAHPSFCEGQRSSPFHL